MGTVNIYANRFMVFNETSDFVIKFGVAFPENKEVAWNAIVYLSPSTAKELAIVLSQAVAEYEKELQTDIPVSSSTDSGADDNVLQ
ncbi:Protein of unknown function [Thermanaeromonas toyohensis ToBE]|uniref:DUF3467 domain-containing protein n=1 Tax=Thermanaeromonas toyohensis ToBE TaxID=698762 RepID=A0A1W1VU18_9FIRM|nr:DUF3467 domain-containing protein [Thermanaeromonas toyohensis]SMB96857.1 Protein of unknown function [Thermanaeromonas toyohensis ToBE]